MFQPQRIRKKNRLFFDDDVVNNLTPKTKRTPGKSPSKKQSSPVKVPKIVKSDDSAMKPDR